MILRITKFYDKTNNRKTYFNYHVITTMIYMVNSKFSIILFVVLHFGQIVNIVMRKYVCNFLGIFNTCNKIK